MIYEDIIMRGDLNAIFQLGHLWSLPSFIPVHWFHRLLYNHPRVSYLLVHLRYTVFFLFLVIHGTWKLQKYVA